MVVSSHTSEVAPAAEFFIPLSHSAVMCSRRYLIEHGAHVGAVNSEGELPLDVATEDAMERLLKEQIKKQGDGQSLADGVPVDAS